MKNKQLKSSSKALPKGGRDYLLSKEEQKESSLMLNKHLTGLVENSRQIARVHSSASAFEQGLVLQTANKLDSAKTKLLLLAELERLVRSVNATRSFQSQEDLQDAVDDIIEIFPSLKVEEILIAFKMIRQGKFELFGNLTTNTLIKCLHDYELKQTVPLREQQHSVHQGAIQPPHFAMIDWQKLGEALIVEPQKKSLEELGGHIHITADDIKEIEKAQEEYKEKNAN
jgi:hypothetical protein